MLLRFAELYDTNSSFFLLVKELLPSTVGLFRYYLTLNREHPKICTWRILALIHLQLTGASVNLSTLASQCRQANWKYQKRKVSDSDVYPNASPTESATFKIVRKRSITTSNDNLVDDTGFVCQDPSHPLYSLPKSFPMTTKNEITTCWKKSLARDAKRRKQRRIELRHVKALQTQNISLQNQTTTLRQLLDAKTVEWKNSSTVFQKMDKTANTLFEAPVARTNSLCTARATGVSLSRISKEQDALLDAKTSIASLQEEVAKLTKNLAKVKKLLLNERQMHSENLQSVKNELRAAHAAIYNVHLPHTKVHGAYSWQTYVLAVELCATGTVACSNFGKVMTAIGLFCGWSSFDIPSSATVSRWVRESVGVIALQLYRWLSVNKNELQLLSDGTKYAFKRDQNIEIEQIIMKKVGCPEGNLNGKVNFLTWIPGFTSTTAAVQCEELLRSQLALVEELALSFGLDEATDIEKNFYEQVVCITTDRASAANKFAQLVAETAKNKYGNDKEILLSKCGMHSVQALAEDFAKTASQIFNNELESASVLCTLHGVAELTNAIFKPKRSAASEEVSNLGQLVAREESKELCEDDRLVENGRLKPSYAFRSFLCGRSIELLRNGGILYILSPYIVQYCVEFCTVGDRLQTLGSLLTGELLVLQRKVLFMSV